MMVWCGCLGLIVMDAAGYPLMLPPLPTCATDPPPASAPAAKSSLDISDGLYYGLLLPVLLPTMAIYRFIVWLSVKFYQYN
jgi:hypothetical protein